MTRLEEIKVCLWNTVWLNTAIPDGKKKHVNDAIDKAIDKAFDI